MRKVLAILIVLLAIWWLWIREAPVQAPPGGVLIDAEPIQTMLEDPDQHQWMDGKWRIRALADYSIRARVLSRARYYADATASIAPLDLALGWGIMSDSATLQYINVSQGGRWYEFYMKPGSPVDLGQAATHSANVHCLPASDTVWRQLKDLAANDFVRMRGYLIEAYPASGDPPWRSSLSRTDTGNGACEIFWVTSVVREPRRG